MKTYLSELLSAVLLTSRGPEVISDFGLSILNSIGDEKAVSGHPLGESVSEQKAVSKQRPRKSRA